MVKTHFQKTSWIREIERLRMNNKFTVNDLNLYYGDFHALKNINLDSEKALYDWFSQEKCYLLSRLSVVEKRYN